MPRGIAQDRLHTAVQALGRKDPVLPEPPGRSERHGFEHFRRGSLSLDSGFNTKTSEVLGKRKARHTSAAFIAFLDDIVANQRSSKDIHVISDNLSAHKINQVSAFLVEDPTVHMYFTPTYSFWRNQAELSFAKNERNVIIRGVTSP